MSHIRRAAPTAALGFLLAAGLGCARTPRTPGAAQQARSSGTAQSSQPDVGAAPSMVPICTASEADALDSIVRATIRAIDVGRRADVIANITSLERAWDDGERTMSPRSPETWRTLDETLDRAIASLRGSSRDADRGRAALVRLRAQVGAATADHAFDLAAASSAIAPPPETAKTRVAAVYTAAEITPFAESVRATIQSLDRGDGPAAVENLTDLEAAWDGARRVLEPRDVRTWQMLDVTLDRAVDALRSASTPNIPVGRAALSELLTRLGEASCQSDRSKH